MTAVTEPRKTATMNHFLSLSAIHNCLAFKYKRFNVFELLMHHELVQCVRCKDMFLSKEVVDKICFRCMDVGTFLRSVSYSLILSTATFVPPPPSTLHLRRWKGNLSKRNSSKTHEDEVILTREDVNLLGKDIKIAAAVTVIDRLENENSVVSYKAAAAAVKILYGKHTLLYDLLARKHACIPEAVCVMCSRCDFLYKMTPLGPNNPSKRLCPWCRCGKRLLRGGLESIKLLAALNHICGDKDVAPEKMLCLLDLCSRPLVKNNPCKQSKEHEDTIWEFVNDAKSIAIEPSVQRDPWVMNILGYGDVPLNPFNCVEVCDMARFQQQSGEGGAGIST